jgi:hypothetical protein
LCLRGRLEGLVCRFDVVVRPHEHHLVPGPNFGVAPGHDERAVPAHGDDALGRHVDVLDAGPDDDASLRHDPVDEIRPPLSISNRSATWGGSRWFLTIAAAASGLGPAWNGARAGKTIPRTTLVPLEMTSA